MYDNVTRGREAKDKQKAERPWTQQAREWEREGGREREREGERIREDAERREKEAGREKERDKESRESFDLNTLKVRTFEQ